jgi:hydrogenase maturation protease
VSDVLIFGCGNEDRGDDGAGLLVARRLRELGIDAREHQGDMLSLMDDWRGAAEVVVIDAMRSGAAPGTVAVWNVPEDPLPRNSFRCSTHALGVADAVELARTLDGLPAKLMIYGIEGRQFHRGGPISVEVAQAIERLAGELERKHGGMLKKARRIALPVVAAR